MRQAACPASRRNDRHHRRQLRLIFSGRPQQSVVEFGQIVGVLTTNGQLLSLGAASYAVAINRSPTGEDCSIAPKVEAQKEKDLAAARVQLEAES
jgi:hypothetical protein